MPLTRRAHWTIAHIYSPSLFIFVFHYRAHTNRFGNLKMRAYRGSLTVLKSYFFLFRRVKKGYFLVYIKFEIEIISLLLNS